MDVNLKLGRMDDIDMVTLVNRINEDEAVAAALLGGQDDNVCTFGNVSS